MKGRAMDTPKEEAETKECGQRMRQGGGTGSLAWNIYFSEVAVTAAVAAHTPH